MGCGEWIHLGAGLRPWALRVLTKWGAQGPSTLVRSAPVPLRPGSLGKRLPVPACTQPGSLRAQRHPPLWEAEEGEAGA